MYSPNINNDLLLCNLWARMRAENALWPMFQVADLSLSQFYDELKPPRQVYLGVCQIGIWYLALFQPVMSGASFSLYLTPEIRGTRAAFKAALFLLDCGLAVFGPLLVTTSQPELLDVYRRLGYTICGSLPGMFDGHDAHMALLTREGFENRPLKGV